MRTRSGLLLDASVLIDYAKADVSILELVARHVAPVRIALPLLDEVDQFTRSDCERLGILIEEPSLDQLLQAAAQRGGPLSFQDRLCIIVAHASGWTCVSNDKSLRRECDRIGVPVLWGLELMVQLVDRGQLTPKQASKTAQAIGSANPRYITKGVLTRFETRVRKRRR